MRGLLLVFVGIVHSAPATLHRDVIHSTVVTGKSRFQCKFTIVLLPPNKVTLKKSKVICNPKKPRRQKASNLKLVGKLGTYLVSLTINPTMLKSIKVEVQEEPSSEKSTTTDETTMTLDPGPGMEPVTCQMGFTNVCRVGETNGCPPNLYRFCPSEGDSVVENGQSTECSCLPNILVQQAVQAGINPLGCGGGCVCVEERMEHCGLTTRDPIKMTTKGSIVHILTEEKKLIYFGPGEILYSNSMDLVLTLPDLMPSNCSVPSYPEFTSIFTTVGTMTKWGTMVCNARTQHCFTYRHGVWNPYNPSNPSSLFLTRSETTAAAWIDGLWWVTGAQAGMTSSDLYDPNTQQWSFGVFVPFTISPFEGHCMVAINTTHVFIYRPSTDMFSYNTYMYSKASGFVKLHYSIQFNVTASSYRDSPSCAVLGHNVWVSSRKGHLKYFNLSSLTWADGPTLQHYTEVWETGLLTVVAEKLMVFFPGQGIHKIEWRGGMWILVKLEIETYYPYGKFAIELDYEDCADTYWI